MTHKFLTRSVAVSFLILAIGGPGITQTAARDRILQPVDSSQTAVVNGTAHPLARPEFDHGRMSSEKPLTGSVVFKLSPAQQSDLDRLLHDQQTASSPSYHKWLTPEQYADRFGMTRSDLGKVSAWLQSQGLTVTGMSRGRTEIYFSGQAGAVENAFGTQLHNYVVNGKEHFANSTALSVPQAFAGVVLSVRGLDDFKPKPMLRSHPRFTSSISGNHFLNPNDFAVIYDLSPLYNAGFDGTGINIAVVGQSEISAGNATTDLDAFRSAAGLSAKDPSFVLVPSTGAPSVSSDAGDLIEADLDLEWSNAVAKNADVIFVFSGANGGAFDAIRYAIDQKLAPIISNSFGLCEADEGQAAADSLWQTIRQGNSQGQTLTSASGDNGAADCDGDSSNPNAPPPKTATRGLSVDVPAAIPEVTGVGGTEFTGDAEASVTGTAPNTCAAATSFWLASPGTAPTCDLSSPEATVISYIPETAWNDTTQDKELSASGGGASTFFAKPSWQAGSGVPADGARDVPDVALNASPDHDSYLICSQAFFNGDSAPVPNSCADGFRAQTPSDPTSTNNNVLSAIGGTSAGAPTFAGILALVLQATGGQGLGNVNPMLYSLASSTPAAFHDITTGSNKVPCTSGTTDCPAGTTSIGFNAGAGYDQATGLGSVDAGQLKTAWLAALNSPPADFVIDGQASTVLPGSSATATINLTATNGFADTVNLSCAAIASAEITCSLNPASVNLSNANQTGTSTLSMVTVAAANQAQPAPHRGTWFAASGGLFAAVLLGGWPSRRRWTGLLALIVAAGTLGAAGCGGGGGSNVIQQKQQGTPTGNYVVTVTATGANTGKTHTLNVNLTVQ